ncbi:hypothetical protein GXP67_18235 [Rhodocytophaga rosea]|uniref:Uncharacterized protein n=1 Tax=Rhodocytophaga rosea TaxID=2704465 RepID=A0A6C0GLD6_9BACT|nr:hypothetical protein [Rhodocytophaga rosea]QHT68442.1 hypothetical protein GXP67_18235 [Rhodocytophaga rosea]
MKSLFLFLQKINTAKSSLKQFIAVLALLMSTIGLSGCNDNVNPSFGYAFAGTWVLLAIAFFIATSVTKKNDDHHGHKH